MQAYSSCSRRVPGEPDQKLLIFCSLCRGWRAERLQLTPEGLERSDAIGPWLYSAQVRALMDAYELR